MVCGVIVRVQLAQAQRASIVLLNFYHLPGRILGGDFVARRDEVDAADGLVVLAHVVITLGAAAMVVEGDTRADDVDERGATMGHGALDQWHQLLLVTREAAGHVGGAKLQGQTDQVHRAVVVDDALLAFGAAVGSGGELSLGKPVDAVVLHNVGHAHTASHCIGKLPQADRRRIAIARDPQVQQVAVGQVCAGQNRRHAPVHGVESVRGAQEVVRRLGTAPDTRQFGHPVRFDVEFPAGLDDGCGNRVMAAAGAQGGDSPLVVAPGVTDLVQCEGGMVQPGLGDVGHANSLSGAMVASSAGAGRASLRMAPAIKRAVIGVPS